MRLAAATAAVLLVCVRFAAQSPPPAPKGTHALPQAERITDHLYRVGGALIDTSAHTVTCSGALNMDKGPIEYLAVTPRGKTYESLLRIDVRPIHLEVALLLLGLDPVNNLRYQGDDRIPAGPPVEVRVQWRGPAGAEHDVRAEALVKREPGGAAMAEHDWSFTGSRLIHEGLQADLDGSLIAIWHDPAAVLDNPLRSGSDNAWMVDSDRAPVHGTPVRIVFHPVEKAAH